MSVRVQHHAKGHPDMNAAFQNFGIDPAAIAAAEAREEAEYQLKIANLRPGDQVPARTKSDSTAWAKHLAAHLDALINGRFSAQDVEYSRKAGRGVPGNRSGVPGNRSATSAWSQTTTIPLERTDHYEQVAELA